jgi:hypothetical protein
MAQAEVSTTSIHLHLFLARTKIEVELNWSLEDAVIPSATKLGTSALCTVLSIAPK